MLVLSFLVTPVQADAAVELNNPVIEKDSSMQAGQKVTYDTVYFGSYPQAEVVASKADMDSIPLDVRTETDFIVDATLYKKLKKATWKKNETTINGKKYRRLKKEQSTYLVPANGWVNNHYNWDNDYHYFKYQPIKWRVLEVSDDEVFLLADKILDCQKYNERLDVMTWEECSLRKFLNKKFLTSAFSKKEKKAIVKAEVENEGNGYHEQYGEYYVIDGGNDTKDKVYLLSLSEVFEDEAVQYGFVAGDEYNDDEAKRAKNTAYAKAMGCGTCSEEDYIGNCNYWLRSPGKETYNATYVRDYGWTYIGGTTVNYYGFGVRPVLRLNLSKYKPTYAGTICTDGTVTPASKWGNQ